MTMTNSEQEPSDCVVPQPLPAEHVGRYSVDRDPDREAEIARYVEIKAPDEALLHVELVKEEVVLGDRHEIWDVTTDQDRYWVITNLTNLYPQRLFPSLDFTLSFHVGLMMRLRSQPSGAESNDPTPFDDVFRRQEQAKVRYDRAIETEDFQTIGMHLRECLLSLLAAIRRQTAIDGKPERPQEANFNEWSDLLLNHLAPGGTNKPLRQYMKNTNRETWQLVNWLTHHRNASPVAASIAIHACDTVVGHMIQLLERDKASKTEECRLCKSRNIRQHYDPYIDPDGDYYHTCGACGWSDHPERHAAGPD